MPFISDDLIQQALGLAREAHTEDDTASAIVEAAMLRLETRTNSAWSTLKERLLRSRKATRLVLTGPALFFRLVCLASEEHARRERQQESRVQTEDRLLARFVQFLVLQTLKRSSRWGAVAFGQFVYRYDGGEVSSLIASVTGARWSERNQKRAKSKLMRLLEDRFGGLRVIDPHDEDYRCFEACANQQRLEPTLWRLLGLFTPWGSRHRGSRRSQAPGAVVSDIEELDRCHSFIHHLCFGLAVADLGLAPYTRRVRLPQLVRSDSPSPTLTNGGNTESLDGRSSGTSEAARLRQRVASQSRRRRGVTGDVLEVFVDGTLVGRLQNDLPLRIRLSEDADLLELYSHDQAGRVLVATHILHHDEDGEITDSSDIIRIGRQIISFDVVSEPAAETGDAVCTIRRSARTLGALTQRPLASWVGAVAALLVLAAGGWLVVKNASLRSEMARAAAAVADGAARERTLQQRIAELMIRGPEPRLAAGTLEAEFAEAAAPSALIAGSPRGVNVRGWNRVLVDSNAPNVHLSLVLDPRDDVPVEFVVRVEDPDGQAVAFQRHLRSTVDRRGVRTVAAVVPTRALAKDGEYAVTLEGATAAHAIESVADYSLFIEHRGTQAPKGGVAFITVSNLTGAPLTVTVDGRAQTVDSGSATLRIPVGRAAIGIAARCGAIIQTVHLRDGAQYTGSFACSQPR